MDPLLELGPSVGGFISVAFAWVGVAPLVPVVALLLWGRGIASRTWFFVVTLVASIGVHHVWTTAVVLLEYLRHSSLQAHPRNALWQFLRFDAQLYIVPLIAIFVVFIIAKHWKRHATSTV